MPATAKPCPTPATRPEPYLDCGSPERTVALIRSMLNSRKPPTALFAANNLTMRYILHALSAAGINIPRQIAVVGFDDFEMADVLQPSLTVVRQPVYQLGEVAANLLFQRISGSEAPKAGHRVTLPVELIVRCSCGCQPRTIKGAKELRPASVLSGPGGSGHNAVSRMTAHPAPAQAWFRSGSNQLNRKIGELCHFLRHIRVFAGREKRARNCFFSVGCPPGNHTH